MALRYVLISLALLYVSGVHSQTTDYPELNTTGITLECTDTQMIVTIPKSLLEDEMKGDDVLFENTDNSTDIYCWGKDDTEGPVDIIRLTTNLTACGTNMTETDDEEIYTNRVVNNYGNDPYTRFYEIDIPIMCTYNRSKRVGYKTYQLTDFTIDKELSEKGKYTYDFEIYKDGTFSEALTDYPLRVGLNKELYFAASVQSLDGTLDLSIRSCRATPSSSYDNPIRYDFIIAGCSADNDTNLTHLTDYRIGVEMNAFRFIEKDDYVYIHCDLLVCDAGDENSICNTDCVGSTPAPAPNARKRRDVSGGALGTRRFTRGPLRVVRAAESSISRMDLSANSISEQQQQQDVTSAFNPWMVAMAAMATVVMALAAVMAVVLRKVSRIADSAQKGVLREESASLLKHAEF